MKLPQDNAPFLYCAMPSRFLKSEAWPQLKTEIEATALASGYYPIPFNLDCSRIILEDHKRIGRKRAFELFSHLLKFKTMSFGLFGIADGTMFEMRFMLRERGAKLIRTFTNFDDCWDKEYKKWAATYGDLLAEVRGKYSLFVLVGGTAVGKTYWSDRLLQKANGTNFPLRRVKNTTTRNPRSVLDFESYNFVDNQTFQMMIRDGQLVEHDEFNGYYYGSSLSRIKKILARSNGVLAITPKGAEELYKLRYEINLKFIVLKAQESLLRQNLIRRGVTDTSKQGDIIKEHETFFLPDFIPHKVFHLNGTESDEQLMNFILSS